jgi:hypothetical protein
MVYLRLVIKVENRFIKYFLIISLILNSLSNYSQTPVLKNYTIKDGLPSNENYFVFQDSKSFIWICTDAGLVKYDANTFKTFNSTHGMPDNTVFEVKEDKLGRIWYRTFAGNIGYVFNDSVFVIDANEKIIDFHKGGTIASFHIDEELNLYVGRQTLDSIAFLKIKPPYKLENVNIIFPKQNLNSWINIILFSNDEFVYAEKRSSKGQKVLLIDVLKNENELIIEDTMPISNVPSALTRIQKRGNVLTLGNYNVLNKINLVSKQKDIIRLNSPIINIYGANSKEIIIAFRDKGILTYDSDLNELPEPLLLENLSCSSIMEDNNAGLWYSTLKNGIFYSNIKNHKMTDVSNGTFKPVYFMKLFGQNKLNIGLEGGDCNLFNCNKGVINYIETMRKVNVDLQSTKSIISINPSVSFLSSFETNELYNYDLRKSISLKNTRIYQYPYADLFHYGEYILGFNYNHAAVFDTVNFEIKHEISTQDRFTAFAYNPLSGESYFGSMHGLYKFYGQTEMKDKDKVNNFRVKDLEYLDNKLIVATKGFGIVIRFGGSVDTLDVNDGILSNVCEKIVPDGSNFWVSSNLGLTQIRYLGFKHYDIINYPLKDFGTSSLIQDFFVQDSTLYFASGHMLYSYPLNEVEKSGTPFYVYKLETNGKVISDFSDVELSSEENSIKVYFAALYYNFKGNARYRYKLSPDDANWTYLKENVILFPSLSSGDYSLIIQAQKNNGSWIECPQIIKFKINPPFWLRWWFIGLVFFLVIGFVIYLTSYINGKKTERELFRSKVKIRLYNLEIKAMKAQMNPHFIFNSLNSIQHFILANENDNAYRYLTKFSKLVRKLLESNEKESLSIATEVDILTKYLEIEALRFKESFIYEIKVDSSLETYKMIPHMMIQPFIENAIWHGLLEKKGERVLTINFELHNEKCIAVTIEDNGIGINKSKNKPKNGIKEKSLALEFIKERLSLFSSTMDQNYSLSIHDKSDLNGNETVELL